MPSDDNGGATGGDGPKELWAKLRVWIETPDGERMWLNDWLDSLPPGTKLNIKMPPKRSNVVPFPGSD